MRGSRTVRSSSDEDYTDDNENPRADPPAVTLTPQKSSIYNRRLRSSTTKTPSLSPLKRRPLLNPVPQVPVPPPNEPLRPRQPFNVFQALLQNPELTFEFSKHLEIDDLVSLYAISKDFHFLANLRFTALILGQSVTKAPESSRIFTFTCYRGLCLRDPNRTQLNGMNGMIRTIPSFKWLRMILFRERVVDEILAHLYESGHRLPTRLSLVLKKLWFTLDFGDNKRRIGLVHNEEFWSSKELFLALMFFVKLDMRLNDPLTGSGHIGLRRMLLNQRSLSTLARVLQREEMQRDIDMMRMMVQYNYTPRGTIGQKILGIEPYDVGKLQFEGWGAWPTKFVPIDELIHREGLKRGLHMHDLIVDMMIFGYIDKRKFEDIKSPPPGSYAGQDYSEARLAQRQRAVDMQERISDSDDTSDEDDEAEQAQYSDWGSAGDSEQDMEGDADSKITEDSSESDIEESEDFE